MLACGAIRPSIRIGSIACGRKHDLTNIRQILSEVPSPAPGRATAPAAPLLGRKRARPTPSVTSDANGASVTPVLKRAKVRRPCVDPNAGSTLGNSAPARGCPTPGSDGVKVPVMAPALKKMKTQRPQLKQASAVSAHPCGPLGPGALMTPAVARAGLTPQPAAKKAKKKGAKIPAQSKQPAPGSKPCRPRAPAAEAESIEDPSAAARGQGTGGGATVPTAETAAQPIVHPVAASCSAKQDEVRACSEVLSTSASEPQAAATAAGQGGERAVNGAPCASAAPPAPKAGERKGPEPKKRSKVADLDLPSVTEKVLKGFAEGKVGKLSVPEMKCYLKAHKQKLGGKKADLEARLVSLLRGPEQ
ncbi:unnamed protein product [Ostreobium quekettii]|uniref:SAP domain-containing protein n=1 Tax=Ostreobium quekettii TaxID=121088 RepID=A0A8S1J9E2_9CHLO|nr:unnamed protein product [Ostreobium quekettii]